MINSSSAQTIICAVPVSGFLDYLQLFIMSVSPIILIVGVIVATKNIASARETARKKATLDMIEKVESMPHYRAMHATFSYHRKLKSFDRLHDPSEVKDKTERTNVLDYLNHYELVGIGIAEDILDEDFYKNWMRGPFVRDWNAAADFVQRERWKFDEGRKKWVYNEQLFEHFQMYATRWSTDAVKLDAKFAGPPDKPAGPGDEAYPKDESRG